MPQTTQPDSCLDLSGLHCPAPLIRCLATLHRLPVGNRLHVTVSNRDALNDIALMLRRGPHHLLDWWQDSDGHCHFHIRKAISTRPRARLTRSWVQFILQRLGWQRPIGQLSAG
ncbi:MAG: sulfurtransferase TusA family protein [Gammaproteobacteria bacterium]|nr:sulfurtransferase TusA family protein [Gammaproteobacteria bacterium]MBU2477613.1 sulfurtransferase TusA family protein [Gammaproteobacteria bacterium]